MVFIWLWEGGPPLGFAPGPVVALGGPDGSHGVTQMIDYADVMAYDISYSGLF